MLEVAFEVTHTRTPSSKISSWIRVLELDLGSMENARTVLRNALWVIVLSCVMSAKTKTDESQSKSTSKSTDSLNEI